jgi:hypothetical protein
MKRLHIAAFILGCMSLSRGAIAADFGIVTLAGNDARTVSIGGSSRTLRVCNEANSAGAVLVTIGGNAPHYLASGDIGDQVSLRSLGASATVDFKANCDSASMD